VNYFWALLGWIWSRKLFFGVILSSTLLFFAWFFPYSDLSDLVTSTVSTRTNGQVYLQFETMDLHFIPQPAVSATRVSVETALPPLEAKWAKFTPHLMGILFSLPTAIKASNGDLEAMRSLNSKLGGSFEAEGLWGGDVSVSVRSGVKSEQGRERSRVSLMLSRVNLGEVQKWSDLPVKMQGQINAESEMNFSLDMQEQPEGEFLVRITKFAIPASTVMVPMGEANLPVNIPSVTLANVLLKGHLNNGTLNIEEGAFGNSKDPISGRIKGQMGMKLQQMGSGVMPLFGSYNLTVELKTSSLIEKELGFAFLTLSPAKTATPEGGGHYLFRATGQGIGMAYLPNVMRISSF